MYKLTEKKFYASVEEAKKEFPNIEVNNKNLKGKIYKGNKYTLYGKVKRDDGFCLKVSNAFQLICASLLIPLTLGIILCVKPYQSMFLRKVGELSGQNKKTHIYVMQQLPQKEAKEKNDQVIQENPFAKEDEQNARKAEEYFEKGDYNDALESIEKIVSDIPTKEAFLEKLSLACLEKNDRKNAYWAIKKIVLNKDVHQDLLRRLIACNLNNNDFAKAEQAIFYIANEDDKNNYYIDLWEKCMGFGNRKRACEAASHILGEGRDGYFVNIILDCYRHQEAGVALDAISQILWNLFIEKLRGVEKEQLDDIAIRRIVVPQHEMDRVKELFKHMMEKTRAVAIFHAIFALEVYQKIENDLKNEDQNNILETIKKFVHEPQFEEQFKAAWG